MWETRIQELSEQILPCNPQKPYAFVSYSKRDAEKVYTSILALQRSGCNLWVDKNMEARADQSWTRLAFDAIQNKNCVAIVFMISGNSVISMPCFCETMYSQRGQLTLSRHRNTPVKMITVNVDGQWDPRRKQFSQWLYDISDRYNDDTLNALSTADRTLLSDLGQMLAPPEQFNIPTSGDLPIAFMNKIYGSEKETDRVTILPVESTGAILKNISETQDKPAPPPEEPAPAPEPEPAPAPAAEEPPAPEPQPVRPPASGPVREEAPQPEPPPEPAPAGTAASRSGRTARSSPKEAPPQDEAAHTEEAPSKKRSTILTIVLVVLALLLMAGGVNPLIFVIVGVIVYLVRYFRNKKRS